MAAVDTARGGGWLVVPQPAEPGRTVGRRAS
jgi:hypothetical protein